MTNPMPERCKCICFECNFVEDMQLLLSDEIGRQEMQIREMVGTLYPRIIKSHIDRLMQYKAHVNRMTCHATTTKQGDE